MSDPFASIAAAAAVTNKILLGTGICLVAQHEPLALAKTVATVDRLSNGRFLFGIGAGWNEDEMENHHVSPKRRWNVTREHVEAMRRLWTQEEASYGSSVLLFFYPIKDGTTRARSPRIEPSASCKVSKTRSAPMTSLRWWRCRSARSDDSAWTSISVMPRRISSWCRF
jgi:alkanesulfonate monooxygenase SsuD/methylene tetrahydromethanopterin reductase-like flavin-dependent oxidoreductase (luciferase family)